MYLYVILILAIHMKSDTRTRTDKQLDAHFATLRFCSSAILKRATENWPMYAAVTGSALAMATNASAGVIYSGLQNLTAGPVSSVGALRMTNGASTVSHHSINGTFLKNGAGFRIGVGQNCCGDGYLAGEALAGGIGGLQFLQATFFSLQKLAKGVNVSTAAGNFGFSGLVKAVSYNLQRPPRSYGFWNPNQTAFAGFRFLTNTTANAKTDYGWVRLQFTDSPNGVPDSLTAVDWAYNADGLPIATGDTGTSGPPATPEPGTGALAFLAAGAAAVAALRRRRSAA